MKCKWSSNIDNELICSHKVDESGYCIFHKKNKTKKENQEMIKLIKENKISNFSGFIFEENFNINEVIDYSYKELNFTETTFIKEALFNNYTFKGKTIFNNTNFLEFTTFKNSKFLYTAIFNNTIFNPRHSNKKIFMGVTFTGQNLVMNSVHNLPRMDGIKFDEYTKFILLDVDYEKEHYINGKINYRIARNQANKIGDHERIGYYYYKERYYGSKNIKAKIIQHIKIIYHLNFSMHYQNIQ